jgi:M6 family metalloprotease-like protein
MRLLAATTSVALGLYSGSAMLAVPSCHLVALDGGCGKSICVYQRGDAYQHWIETEHGHSLCRTPAGQLVFAGEGDATGGLNCSGAPLRCGSLTPRPGVRKGLRPKGSAPRRDNDSLFARIVRSRHGGERERALLSASGPVRLRNLVLLMRWKDSPATKLPASESYDTMINKPGGDVSISPSGSVSDVFRANFYGRIAIESVVVGWVDVPYTQREAAGAANPDGSGCGGICTAGNPQLQDAIRYALQSAEEQGLVDIGDFDMDGDGQIDIMTLIHSGHDQSAVPGGADMGWIWSHKADLAPTFTSRSGTNVTKYNINPGLWDIVGFEISRIGVIAHESMHYLGLPDLYDSTYASMGIGNYGLLANSWGYDNQQRYPPSLSAWSKVELGVVDAVDISSDGVYSLPSQSTGAGSVIRIKTRFGTGADGKPTYLPDYLLLENRQPIGFDKQAPGGALLWHVDPGLEDNSEVGYPGDGQWPTKHYKVRIIPADGKFDLERNVNAGDAADWFTDGALIDDLTEPSLTSYALIDTPNCSGHRLSQFSKSQQVMTFRYTAMSQACTGKPVASNDDSSVGSNTVYIVTAVFCALIFIAAVVIMVLRKRAAANARPIESKAAASAPAQPQLEAAV